MGMGVLNCFQHLDKQGDPGANLQLPIIAIPIKGYSFNKLQNEEGAASLS